MDDCTKYIRACEEAPPAGAPGGPRETRVEIAHIWAFAENFSCWVGRTGVFVVLDGQRERERGIGDFM